MALNAFLQDAEKISNMENDSIYFLHLLFESFPYTVTILQDTISDNKPTPIKVKNHAPNAI